MAETAILAKSKVSATRIIRIYQWLVNERREKLCTGWNCFMKLTTSQRICIIVFIPNVWNWLSCLPL